MEMKEQCVNGNTTMINGQCGGMMMMMPNMNMSQGSPLSSDLQTSYNNAKNSVNSILGITPTNQQFGYSAQPYGLLSSTNMADNPYNIPYLQQRGLI